jgi:hypothetical protein
LLGNSSANSLLKEEITSPFQIIAVTMMKRRFEALTCEVNWVHF